MREHWLTPEGHLMTTKGLRADRGEGLRKEEGIEDDGMTHWIEFWDGEELVHRSVCIGLRVPE